MNMLKELDTVVLLTDLPQEGLKEGDVGTIVHRYARGKALEVEFMTLVGNTVAVSTLLASQVRPVGKHDITHIRTLSVA